ncbi:MULTISPECIES: PLD nuclease N-terminal domain-containing protein [Aequorivita]|uniref:PLD nuclease N-terminal domain-containing protein n=2 Tax=Aequorivita TaxID=153265 RepID=A0AB35YWP7_9FLAO|nr:PLD nuclease N-terminal domain-containing protein [Aequorivita sp. Ant34-E75]WGF93395.1 PLD nuclease N-terminal domain-containing protein [Aequorivita sp. Ant34-E75]
MIFLSTIGVWQIVLIIVILIITVLPILALINILQNEFTSQNKLIWVLVVLFLPLFGSVLYFALGNEHKLKKRS